MASVFVDIPGIGNVEAKNAATEATLREILKSLQAIDKNTSTTVKEDKKGRDEDKKGGDKKGGGGGGNWGQMGKAIGAAIRPIQMVTGGFIALGTASTNLIQSFANAGDTFSGAASVFSKIPVLGGLFGAVAGAADKVLGSFQAATAGGATFGGSINEFAGSASAAGMTMDKFGGLIARNSEALMTLGGTTENGAKQFASMAKDIRSSQIGAQLYGLGMTTEQVNQGMASYVKTYGANGALQGKSTKELAQGAGQYLKELDALAKITGQNREELQKEQEARMKDAQFRAATANLDEKQAKMMNNFISSFPKEQQEAVKEMIATGNITSEAGVMLNNSMPGLAESIIAQGNAVRNGVKVTEASYDRIYANGVREAKINSKSEEARTQALFNSQQFGNAYIGMAELAKRDADGKKKALTEQEKVQASQAAAMEKNKQTIAAMSNSFQMVLANSGILDTLMKLFQFTADITMKYLVPAFTLFSDVISNVVGSMVDNLGPAVTAVGDFIMKNIYPAFQALVAFVVVDMLPGIMKAVGDFIPVILGVADAIMPPLQAVGAFIFDNLTPILIGVVGLLGVWAAGIAASNIINASNLVLEGARNGTLLASIAGFLGVNATLLPFIAIGAAVVVGLTALWLVFKKLGGDVQVVGDAFNYMGLKFKDMFLALKEGIFSLLNKIPGMRGDFDNDLKEIQEERKQNAEEREKIEKGIADRMAANRAEADAKDQKREDVKSAMDLKAIKEKRAAADAAKDANKKEAEAKEEAVKNYADPVALLKQEATQQKSAFIKDVPNTSSPEAAKKAMVADADAKKAAEEKAKAEAAKEILDTGKTGGKGGTSTPAPATQESAETLLASLNTKMDQLIKINKGSHDVHEQQLSVQKSLSGDLYQNIV
jgi:hypothetical protein